MAKAIDEAFTRQLRERLEQDTLKTTADEMVAKIENFLKEH